MPIDTKCPFCGKSYRLRDEFVGKRVKCGNTDCQKSFPVESNPPSTNGVHAPAPVAKAVPPSSPAIPPAAKPAAPGPTPPAEATRPDSRTAARPVAPKQGATQNPAGPPAAAKNPPRPAASPPAVRPAPPADAAPPKKPADKSLPTAAKKTGTPSADAPRAGSSRSAASKSQKADVGKGDDHDAIDAEALAAALFEDADPVAAGQEDLRVISMTCPMCDHKWTEPYAKQGKFTICPDCRHRQKVPDQKKAKAVDWRDPTADRPTLAKGEELPDDLKLQQTRTVRIDSLEKAGAIEGPEIEPRPFRQKLTFALTAAGCLFLIGFLTLYLLRSKSDSKEQRFMADVVNHDLPKMTDAEYPAGQGPLMRALAHIAAGEYAARGNSRARRDEAVNHFAGAKNELEKIKSKSLERDLLLGELAISVLMLGGTDEQVQNETRLRWLPQVAQGNRPKIAGDATTVQAELRRVLAALHRDNQEADFDFRSALIRRLAFELAKVNQSDLLEEIAGQAFSEAELPEATAQIALELHRHGLDAPRVRRMADQVREMLKASSVPASPLPITAQVLWQVVNPPLTEVPTIVGPPGGSETGLASRSAFSLLAACKNDLAEVQRIARLPGGVPDRLKAMALAASYSQDPGPILEVAAELVVSESRADARSSAQFAILQLALEAVRIKDLERAKTLSSAIPDAGIQAWALGETTRRTLAPGQKCAAETTMPGDSAALRVGHAWGCVASARHNAAATGDAAAVRQYSAWMAGLVPFGKAGLALGLQDRSLR